LPKVLKFQQVAADERKINGAFREHSTGLDDFARNTVPADRPRKMIRFSLVVLFVMSLATLTVAASALPSPPEVAGARTAILASVN